MPLFAADGTACGATAAIQYVTDYSGHWSVLLSAVLGVLTFAAGVGGFALLGRRGALWAVVLLCGGLLGLAFAVLTPPLVGPDEYTHLAVSYERVSELLGQPVTKRRSRKLGAACPPLRRALLYGPKRRDRHLCLQDLALRPGEPDGRRCAAERGQRLHGRRAVERAALRRAGRRHRACAGARVRFPGDVLAGRLGNLLSIWRWPWRLWPSRRPPRRGAAACVVAAAPTLQLAGSLSADATVLGLGLSLHGALLPAAGTARPASRRSHCCWRCRSQSARPRQSTCRWCCLCC